MNDKYIVFALFFGDILSVINLVLHANLSRIQEFKKHQC